MNGTPPSLISTPGGPAPAVAAPRPGGVLLASPDTDRLAWLSRRCDPEWPLFVGFLLLPALTFLIFGQLLKAEFFGGMAIYLAALKWLGWLVLSRRQDAAISFILWPAQLFAGLALLVAWFYLRNALGWLWPGGYSLRELSVVPIVAAILHGLALILRRLPLAPSGPNPRRELMARVSMYGSFVLALTVALWLVSGTLGVQAVDPVLHAFSAKIYLHDGMFHPVGPDQVPLRYPSGFAAVNTVAAAISTLSPVQAVNLQHVLWLIVGLFLATGTVVFLAGRLLPLLHVSVLPFLVLFPIYGLVPDYGYSGTPRQMAPPLFLAMALLPALAPTEQLRQRVLVFAVAAVLAVLTLVLNPICAPFTLAALTVAACVQHLRSKTAICRILSNLCMQAGCILLAAFLILGCDRHYISYVRKPHVPSTAGEPVPSVPALRFSMAAGWGAVRSVQPFDLTPTVMLESEAFPYPELLEWPRRFPQRLIPWTTFGLAIIALAAIVPRRRWRSIPGTPALGLLVGMGVLAFFVLKYAVAFVAGGVTSEAWKAEMLQVYLQTMQTRVELVLLFTILAGSIVLIHLVLRHSREFSWTYRRLAPAGVAGVGLLLVVLVAGGYMRSGYYIMPDGHDYAVAADDLRLVAWMDENLSGEQGQVGLAATTYTWGPEKHVYALGGAQAVVQYGRRDRFRFGLRSLEKNRGYEEYVAHVRDRFDGNWCLEHEIRFFYVDRKSLKLNPGLANAIHDGRLKPIKEAGESALYEVVATAEGGKST
jgi:hypothetical protein